MKYITLGIPKTMNEVTKESMPRIFFYQDKSGYGIFAAYLINSEKIYGFNLRKIVMMILLKLVGD